MSPFLVMSLAMVIIMFMVILMLASRYVKVPPNKAMVIYGHKFKGKEGMMIMTGGGKFILPIIENFGWLDLEVTTLNIKVAAIITRDHHMANVDCVVQAQIDPSAESLKTASVMLLQKTQEEIEYITQKTLEGHVRGVCASLSLQEIHSNMENVSTEIGSSATQDLMNMGIAVVSFVIHNVSVYEDEADGAGNQTQAALLRAQVETLEARIADLEAHLEIDEDEDLPPPPPPPE